jgi:hypothetical protein
MSQTAAAVQAVLDSTGKGPTIVRGPIPNQDGTTSSWYVFGGIGCRVPAASGRWISTTDSDSAATQAAAILAALQ